MAEYYFNSRIKGLGKESEFKAESRGLYAESHLPMSGNAKKVLISNNIMHNIADILHKSQQIDEEIMHKADFIYGITTAHEKILKEDYPQYRQKIFAMPENINDPYGGTPEVYEDCFEKIKQAADIIINSIMSKQESE